MQNISHIKIRPIHIILWGFLGCWMACYMPRGGFLANAATDCWVENDSVKINVPVEFQGYNYFRIIYMKNEEVYLAQKINDSTIVFLSNFIVKKPIEGTFRVEAGIIPFDKKKE